MSTEIRSIQDCPDFLRELVAKELCVPLDKVNGWIDTEDEKGLERIEAVILWLDEHAKELQSERLTPEVRHEQRTDLS